LQPFIIDLILKESKMLLQTQSHSLRPLTTAHLAQTMTLLGLPAHELRQKIESALASNPALELIEERRCPTCHRRLSHHGSCPICTRPQATSSDQPIVFISAREDVRSYKGRISTDEELPDDEWAAAVEELPAYVLRQISPELEPDDRQIAAHILTSLDDNGLLPVEIVEIARYHHVLISRVEEVISLIQHADPIGVGSHTPQEALLVQARILAETGDINPLVEKAIQEGWDFLSRRAYSDLGRLLGISATKAREIAFFITENLNPFPGHAHWGDNQSEKASPLTYNDPDIIVSCLNDAPTSPLVVEISSPYAGRLRVNPLFREALANAPEEKADQWQSELDQASLLVKCLQQRNHTLVRLLQRMVVIQRQFILHGDANLCPVTRAQLAFELNVHESTISRAVSGKALQLPNRRIIPLSKLFDRSLHIRTALRQIIEKESKPLSDTQISKLLDKQGYSVARRTVAKYRAMEGILPARYRHSNQA
jgi:RNA polymerase sigma-54 factor